MTALSSDTRTGRSLVGDDLFGSLAHFVATHFGQEAGQAERIADQALAFVATASTATVPMVPSDDVDHGLHAFILHTKDYADFCGAHAGRFLHHNPKPGGRRTLEAVQASAQAMKAARFMVLDDLWTLNGENAAQCDSDCGRDYGQP